MHGFGKVRIQIEAGMRVLLVEDNIALAQATEHFLKQKGFIVDVAATLDAARMQVPLAEWGAVLLDLHLPDGDGLSLLPMMRRRVPEASVIIMTARDQITDRIHGLDAGADDYLIKPVDPSELLARLRAIERRRSGNTSSVVKVGDLQIDLGRGLVLVQEFPVELTAKEWAMLRVMAARPDRIHTKEALSAALYAFGEEASSNTLEVYISQLRRKLGKLSIHTLRGQGYRLTGDASV
jgi:two-component system, OmpR family, response regulator